MKTDKKDHPSDEPMKQKPTEVEKGVTMPPIPPKKDSETVEDSSKK